MKKQFIKAYVQKAEEDEKLGRLQVSIASDSSEDRDGDVIKVEGWNLDNFSKNPILLWAHNPYSPPIGRVAEISVKRGKLLFIPEFDLEDEFAKAIFNKYKKGILSTFSVGFQPVEWKEGEQGYIFEKQELLEISAVSVPANPNASVMRELEPVYSLASIKGYKLDEEAQKIRERFFKKNTKKDKLDVLFNKINQIEYQVNKFSPKGETLEGNQNKGNSENGTKPSQLSDVQHLRDQLVLLDKAVEIVLKNMKGVK